jgi:cell wall-associated NlpC family hydrolase
MQSELGMMDDQASQEQLQGKYKLQDIEKFMGRAEYYDKGFKGVDKVRADKKEEAKVKAEKLAEGRLGNIGEAIMKAKNPAEAESWIGKYNDEAIKQGKPPIDDAQRFVIMESVNQQTLANANEIAYFKAAYDPIDKTIKRYAGAKMPEAVAADLQARINALNTWGAPRGLMLPAIDPNATPEWEMKTEKALREANMWDVDLENKKQEGINKKLTAEKTRRDIEVVNQKIRQGKATPGDLIYKSFLQGEPVSPEEVKTYLKDKAKVLDNSFETAGSHDKKWAGLAVVNIRTQLDEMAAFLGPDHPAVIQAFRRSAAQGYLDPKYKDMDHAAFSKHWKTGKAIFDQYGQKKKSVSSIAGMEAINGYQKVERNGKQVIRTGNGMEYPLGVPYAWGGESTKGADCSGIVCMSMSKSGIKVPRTTAAGLFSNKDFFDVTGQMYNPDDLLFFDTASTHGKGGVDHVAVYIGNGMMFHAPSKGKPSQIISVDKYLKSGAKFLGARRHTKLK